MDICRSCSQRPDRPNKLFISMRPGVLVLAEIMDGTPADKASGCRHGLRRQAGPQAGPGRRSRRTIGMMEDYGLPKPD